MFVCVGWLVDEFGVTLPAVSGYMTHQVHYTSLTASLADPVTRSSPPRHHRKDSEVWPASFTLLGLATEKDLFESRSFFRELWLF